MHRYAIAFGTFDGLHLGHIEVLNRIKSNGYIPLAITFNVPPKMPNKSNLILTTSEKSKLFDKMGIKQEILDFEKVRNVSPLEFLNGVYEKYSPELISTGFNFRFGKNAQGDKELLQSFCSERGIAYSVSQPVTVKNTVVSSTNIRNYISNGDMSSAAEMLNRSFYFEGTIIHGDKRGRTIGYPTINQVYPKELVCPKAGVYSGYTEIDGVSYRSVTNVGFRPTFKTRCVMGETYLFDFDGDVYGKNARVHLCDFIRSEIKFNSLEELKKNLNADTKKAVSNFKSGKSHKEG